MKFFTTGHNKKKRAFTLIEVMLLLLVLSLIFASATSVITRKHKLKPRRTVHGQYICYRNRDDGLLHEIMFSGKSVLLDRNQAEDPTFTQCEFDAPASAPYLYVQLLGGGGAGGNANHNSNDSYTGILYPEATNTYSYIDFLNNITTTGLTADYIRSAAPSIQNKTPFSIRAFKKLIKDANLHMFVYDYTGASGPGGYAVQRYYELSGDETELGLDPRFWYESLCNLSNDVKEDNSSATDSTPFACTQALFGMGIMFETELGSKIPYNSARNYCQLRSPIAKNCPWAINNYVPTYSELVCDGGAGGKGGLFTSDVYSFDLNTSYRRGVRYQLKADGSVDKDKPITDWGGDDVKGAGDGNHCYAKLDWEVDKANSHPGVLLPFDEACPDGVGGACFDIEGKEIKNPLNIDGYVASTADYRQGYGTKPQCIYQPNDEGILEEVCTDVPDTSKTVLDYFKIYPTTWQFNANGSISIIDQAETPAFYFKEYPVVKLKFNLNDCINTSDYTSPIKFTDGKPAGLPYFPEDDTEGIKVCQYGTCVNYTSGNSELVSGNIMSTPGKAIEDYDPRDVVDVNTGTLIGEPDNPRTLCPSAAGLDGVDGSKTLNFPTRYGQYHYCSGSAAFMTDEQWMFLNEKASGNRDQFVANTYKCPSYDDPYSGNLNTETNIDKRTRGGAFGLKILHRYLRGFLYYGERGGAGEYRAVFARTFGTSKLVMEPGKGGKALANITPGNSDIAESGEKSRLGTGCTGEGLENCKLVYSTNGGLGGRSHLKSNASTVLLTSEEIMEYVNNPDKAPEPKYSDNYENNSYLGEESDFQKISFLTDLTGLIDDPESIQNLGRGGNGGYVKHNCWLMPQYFIYFTKGTTYENNVTNQNNWATVPNVSAEEALANGYEPVGETLDEWEGYTNFSSGVIGNLNACKGDGSTDAYKKQFEETPGENGYSGAIVIMW